MKQRKEQKQKQAPIMKVKRPNNTAANKARRIAKDAKFKQQKFMAKAGNIEIAPQQAIMSLFRVNLRGRNMNKEEAVREAKRIKRFERAKTIKNMFSIGARVGWVHP